MWNYEKRLQYPVKITQTNPKIAKIIITPVRRAGRGAGGVHALSLPEIYDAI